MKLRALQFKQNRFFLPMVIMLFILIGGQGISFGQNEGDYQSAPDNGTIGNWQNILNWLRWDGDSWEPPGAYGWPGLSVGTGDVTILSGHEITVDGNGITTELMGTMTIASGGQLSLSGVGGNTPASHYFNTLLLIVESTVPSGVIYMTPKSNLELPLNAVLVVGPGALPMLQGDCTKNVQILIGGQLIATCAAGPGDVYTFAQLMAEGGTLDAIITIASTVCEDGAVLLEGNFDGVYGTTTPGGSISGVNYEWIIIDPNGVETLPHPTTQNYTIDPAIYDPGENYSIALKVNTYLGSTEFHNTETIDLRINPLPQPSITGEIVVSSNESGVVYTTQSGFESYLWTVSAGGTITDPSVPEDEMITVTWGSPGTENVTVSYTNSLTGCVSIPEQIFVEIKDKVSVQDGIWAQSTTWDPPGAPTANIPSFTVLHNVTVDNSVSSPAVCSNMIIDAGMLQVDPGSALTVLGDITNNVGSAGLVLKADNTGAMGSLIHNNAVQGTVEQFLQYSPPITESWQWHLVSSPISDGIINTYFDMYLYQYDESKPDGSYWVNYWDPVTAPLYAAEGYIVTGSEQYIGQTTVQFESATGPGGSLNYDDFVLNGFTRDSPELGQEGFELIGNPFPCALEWNTNWSLSNMSGWMSVLDNTGAYRSYHTDGTAINGGTAIIPSTQGFFVRATSLPASLTIPATEKRHDNTPFYKESKEYIYPIVRLEAGSSEYTDECVVVFHPEGHVGFDDYYDLGKFTNSDGIPNLYSSSKGRDYAFNLLPEEYLGTKVAVNFEHYSPGIYQIKATEFDNFPQDVVLYLQDIKTGDVITLDETSTYDFVYSTQDDPHRFNLKFKQTLLEVDDIVADSKVLVYSAEDIIYISMPEANPATVVIYDLMGREIMSQKLSGEKRAQINLGAETGYYVVKVQTSNQFVTEKVFVK